MVLYPLPDIARQVTDAMTTSASALAADRPGAASAAAIHHRARTGRLVVTPGLLSPFPTAPGRILPLGFGRKTASCSFDEGLSLLPVDAVALTALPRVALFRPSRGD
jgi:hypothetical protein